MGIWRCKNCGLANSLAKCKDCGQFPARHYEREIHQLVELMDDADDFEPESTDEDPVHEAVPVKRAPKRVRKWRVITVIGNLVTAFSLVIVVSFVCWFAGILYGIIVG